MKLQPIAIVQCCKMY